MNGISNVEEKGIELSVIVPCCNEKDSLAAMAEELSIHLDRVLGSGRWQFVFACNGCRDTTADIASRLCEKWPASIALCIDRADYGNALREGLNSAQGTYAYIINVDFWDDKFLAWSWLHRNDYDLIIGSKRADHLIDDRPKYRKLLSWGLNSMLQIYFGLVTTDTHGQKLLRMDRLRPILDACVMSRGQFDTEFTIRSQKMGLKTAEVPVPITEKRKQRNWMIKKILQNLIDIRTLKKVISKTPDSGAIHYHRFSRDDVELFVEQQNFDS